MEKSGNTYRNFIPEEKMDIEFIKKVITLFGKPKKITIEIPVDNYKQLVDSIMLDKSLSEFSLVATETQINPRICCFGCTIEFKTI